MEISREEFEKIAQEEIDQLPEDVLSKIHNVAFLIQDEPSPEQYRKHLLGKSYVLYGLYEGFFQSSRRNLGTVLPDRITLFRKAIAHACSSQEELRKQIRSTIKHEIAHHFGSDEKGARKASH